VPRVPGATGRRGGRQHRKSSGALRSAATSVALPPGAQPVKLSCTDQALPTVNLSICNATAKGTLMSFSLVLPMSADADMQRVLRSHLERLLKGIEAGSK